MEIQTQLFFMVYFIYNTIGTAACCSGIAAGGI